MWTNFDPVPNDDLDLMADNLMSLIDIAQKYPGTLSVEVLNLLSLIESDLCAAMIARGLIVCYDELDDLPIIETQEVERITDEMPCIPEFEPEIDTDDTQLAGTAFDEYIETLPFDDEDNVL